MTSWTSLPTEEAFITLRALGRVALTVFGMSVVAQHQLEARREILTADGVEDDARVLFHLLNRGLLGKEVMD